jgi:hypothetical protein
MREVYLVDMVDESPTPARSNDYGAHEKKGLVGLGYGIVVAFHR